MTSTNILVGGGFILPFIGIMLIIVGVIFSSLHIEWVTL